MIKEVETTVEFDEAIKEGKVLVDFYAVWCGPCKMLAPIVEKVIEENPSYTLLRVDVDKCEDLARRYGIVSIPTLIFFKDGKLVNQSVGYIGEDSVKKFIEIA